MDKIFYDVTFNGRFTAVCEMIEGFLLAAEKNWEWFTINDFNFKTDTILHKFRNLIRFRFYVQHIILEKGLLDSLIEKSAGHKAPMFIKPGFQKSAREIKGASFTFNVKAFTRNQGTEIKALLSAPPAGVSIKGFHPVENLDIDAEEMELYAVEHAYTMSGAGTASGGFTGIVELWKGLDNNSLFDVSPVKLLFE